MSMPVVGSSKGFYLAELNVKCPRCGIAFISRQLPVVLDTGLRDSELRQNFSGLAPQQEEHSILTCPSCGNADWARNFSPTKDPAYISQPNTTAHLQYRQAALNAERERNSYKTAVLYLHAAWCADDVRAYPQAREYRRLALVGLRRSLVEGSCPVKKRAESEYLIGELLRRSGDFEGCRAHFREVIGRLPGKLAYMARKLMRLSEMSNVDAIPFDTEGA